MKTAAFREGEEIRTGCKLRPRRQPIVGFALQGLPCAAHPPCSDDDRLVFAQREFLHTLFSLLLALTLCACGYEAQSRLPGDPESISVPIAWNDTLYRGAEVTYTRELTRELLRRTAVRVVSRGEASARLEARIVEAPRFPLAEDRVDRILEDAILVRVSVRYFDALTGEDLIEPFEVARRAERIVPRGETLETAIDEALKDVARETVVRLEALSRSSSR